jgi:putative membrane protein
MLAWTNSAARVLAWLVVAMQTGFGMLEMFAPRWVFDRVFVTYRTTSTAPVWVETEKLAHNMGLYNWFLALGLLLSLMGRLGGVPTSQFFLLCVVVAGAFGLFSVGLSTAFSVQLTLGLLTSALFLKRT